MRRTGVGKCAACGRSVRNFAGRLVCDGCSALSIPRNQFIDLMGGDVEILDDTPTERACPRCEGRLIACRISVAGVDLNHDTLHCTRDGNVWLPGGLLEHMLVATERESHREVPSPRGAAHFGPGEFDLEREEARIRMIETWRTWSRSGVLAFAMLLGLIVIASAGWWCIASFVVFSIVGAIMLMPPRGLEPALASVRLSPRPTSLVRWRR